MTEIISRGVPLDDLTVTGRTVTAYAAVFNSPTEISDGQGRYIEQIHRTAFNKTVREAGKKAGYFYNHGMTIHGTPSDMGSVPLGVAERVSTDNKGLLTVSRISTTPFGDAILEAIRDGGVTGYSFTAKIHRSDPARMPRARAGELPTVTRMELGLREYGPTPFPAYADAEIVSVRSGLPFTLNAATLSETDKATLLYEFLMRATGAQPVTHSTSSPEAGTEAPSTSHADRVKESIRQKIDASGVRNWNGQKERDAS